MEPRGAMNDPTEAREELAKVSSLVVTARSHLATGKLVDLSAIENRVRKVCGAVEAMPRDEGKSLVDDMQSLIHKLDQLAREVQSRLKQFEPTAEGSGD